jgi:hypothetical protein
MSIYGMEKKLLYGSFALSLTAAAATVWSLTREPKVNVCNELEKLGNEQITAIDKQLAQLSVQSPQARSLLLPLIIKQGMTLTNTFENLSSISGCQFAAFSRRNLDFAKKVHDFSINLENKILFDRAPTL